MFTDSIVIDEYCFIASQRFVSSNVQHCEFCFGCRPSLVHETRDNPRRGFSRFRAFV